MNQETWSTNGGTRGAEAGPQDTADLPQIADLLGGALTAERSRAAPPIGVLAAGVAAPSFGSFAGIIDQLVQIKPELLNDLQRLAARVARQYLVERDLPASSQEEFLTSLRAPIPATRGGTVVRTFWWGFHVQISHEDLQSFVVGAATVNTIVMAIGGGIPSPAQPFILLIGGFIIGALAALKALDRGRGIRVSMSWFAPGAFVPTPV